MKDLCLSATERALRRGTWFDSLPNDLRQLLLQQGSLKDYVPGETLFVRGDAPSGLFAVVSGRVSICGLDRQGREAVLTLLEPPSWFGEVALFDDSERTHDARVEQASQIFHVSDSALQGILQQEPQYWRDFGRLLSSKLRLAFVALEDLALLPASLRLMRRLVLMAEGYGDRRDCPLCVVDVQQEQLGNMLSISRQTTNQILKELSLKGLIEIRYGRIYLLDLDALRKAAYPE